MRDASPKIFHLRNGEGDLKGFQTNFETLFLQQRGILVRMRQESLFGAFGAISIF